MEILVPVLIALIIVGIAAILDRRNKSRKQSEKHAKNEGASSTTSGAETQTPEKTVQRDKSVEGADVTPTTPSISEPPAKVSEPSNKVSTPPATVQTEPATVQTDESVKGTDTIPETPSISEPPAKVPESPANEGASSKIRSAETHPPENAVQTDKSVKGAVATPKTPSISEPKTPEKIAKVSVPPAKVSEPANYPDTWKKDSRHYREQKEWQCEMCKLSLHQHKHYLHTHHIYGTRYDNLKALCIGCHSEQQGINHLLLKETPEYQGFIARYGKKWRMSSISDFESIRNKFRKYVEHESNILHYISSRGAYINYESNCPKENGSRVVWMNARIPNDTHKISASICIDRNSRFFKSHYQKLKAHRSNIEAIFSFEAITPIEVNSNVYQFRVENKNIDLTQIAKLDTNFHWLRETLEKLYWVLRLQETLGWDHTLSESQSSPNYLEPFNLSGPEIRKRRIALGLTQVQVARELGMQDGTSIGDWENERAKIPPRHHEKLLEILK